MSSKPPSPGSSAGCLENLTDAIVQFEDSNLAAIADASFEAHAAVAMTGCWIKRWIIKSNDVMKLLSMIWDRYHRDSLKSTLAHLDAKARSPIAAKDDVKRCPARPADEEVKINVGGDVMTFTLDDLDTLMLSELVLPITVIPDMKLSVVVDQDGIPFLDGSKTTLGVLLTSYVSNVSMDNRQEPNKKRKVSSTQHVSSKSKSNPAIYSVYNTALRAEVPAQPSHARPLTPFVIFGEPGKRSNIMTELIWEKMPFHIKAADPYKAFQHNGELSQDQLLDMERQVLNEDKTLIIFKTKHYVVAAYYGGRWSDLCEVDPKLEYTPSTEKGSGKEAFIIMQTRWRFI